MKNDYHLGLSYFSEFPGILLNGLSPVWQVIVVFCAHGLNVGKILFLVRIREFSSVNSPSRRWAR